MNTTTVLDGAARPASITVRGRTTERMRPLGQTSGLPSRPRQAAEGSVNFRVIAMLRAVAAGRAQLTCSTEPDLFVDGLPCCDQFTARTLAHDGLVRPGRPGLVGQRVPAILTDAGRAALGTLPVAA